jgi:hypothetical protein
VTSRSFSGDHAGRISLDLRVCAAAAEQLGQASLELPTLRPRRAAGCGRVRRNHATIGQELARVVEDDDVVAQQAPPMLGVEGDGMRRATVRAVGWMARSSYRGLAGTDRSCPPPGQAAGP